MTKTKFENIKNLSDKKILEGIKCCFDNSNNLFSSSLALKRNKKFGVATSILTLSVEELIKSFTLFNILLSDIEGREVYRDIFESRDLHGSRLDFALFMNEYLKVINLKKLMKTDIEINSPKDLSSFLGKKINMEKVFKNIEKEKKTFNNWFDQANERKNAGLYVAFNNKWVTPNRIDEKYFLKALKETKVIRNDISTILTLIININENELESVINFFKETIKHLVSEVGVEPTAQ